MKSGQRDTGSLMITVIAMIFIVSIIIFAGSTLVISGSKNAHTVATMKQAHYMAEAGIEDALSGPSIITYPFPLEPNKFGRYEVKVIPHSASKEIEITSTGWVEDQSGNILTKPKRQIICRFNVELSSFYDLALTNAIATTGNLASGKVYIYLDEGVDLGTDADVYSDAEVTSIAGTVPGSVIAQGGVVLENNATVTKDVIANGTIILGIGAQVRGKVISAKSYIDIENNAQVTGDTVAYGINNDEKYAVSLTNTSIVHDIYTPTGAASEVKPNGLQPKPIEPTYPATYEVPRKTLPTIGDEIKNSWIAQAQRGDTYNGLTLANGETREIGNAYITGDLILNQNSHLEIEEGSIIYVTGEIKIENGAEVKAVEVDKFEPTLISSLITEKTFTVNNKAIPTSVSLVALGEGTSTIGNNSVTTGAILVLNPNGDLRMENEAKVHGTIFANTISYIGNNAKVYFNPFFILDLLLPTAINPDALTLLKWEEGVSFSPSPSP